MALLITSNDEVPATAKKYNGLGDAPIPTLAVDAVPIWTIPLPWLFNSNASSLSFDVALQFIFFPFSVI